MNGIGVAQSVAASAANAWDVMLGDGVADLRPTPRSIIDEGPQRTVFRYRREAPRAGRGSPVLLVPPLAAPASCFDLRRGCSLAQHLLAHGHPTYLLDYGPISFSDRQLGLEHWIEDVIPRAVEAVRRDAGGGSIQLVGWCLGGIMSLLSVAAHPELPVRSVATVASPFDFSRVRLMAPIRPLAAMTGGRVVTALYRAMGGAPAPLVGAGYRLMGIDKYVRKPLTMAQHLSDRDFLAQLEAVDDFMGNMLAYPGRTFGQLYHRFFIVNELAAGTLELPSGPVDLANVRVPVLVVAGEGDGIAPKEAVHAVVDLLPNAPSVRYETAPGGHLGVLTGRAARRTTWVYLDEFLSAADARAAGPPAVAAA
ncbi:MAG: poly[(R)-3-hydroxyalkanoate] polymerase subunit PhaC [Solirubrobacteraceae bacterium]|jgi:polyhydroxyalkanoate synthase|nr:poly[(R)-3-hydroxyalkanoate] polymerase subunit PhaC [Solirubrobacteraceae bacterium]